jgi:hypothetical protein
MNILKQEISIRKFEIQFQGMETNTRTVCSEVQCDQIGREIIDKKKEYNDKEEAWKNITEKRKKNQ